MIWKQIWKCCGNLKPRTPERRANDLLHFTLENYIKTYERFQNHDWFDCFRCSEQHIHDFGMSYTYVSLGTEKCGLNDDKKFSLPKKVQKKFKFKVQCSLFWKTKSTKSQKLKCKINLCHKKFTFGYSFSDVMWEKCLKQNVYGI